MNDAAARRRIVTDLEVNFLVEASAGSGKTHSLVSRIVAGVLNQTYQIQNVAAVTFTRKAAAELSGRLRLELEKAGAHQALARFPEMFVGTVHAFCGRILREYPVQAGISPAFREIEQREDELLQRAVLRAALEQSDGQRLLRLLKDFGAGSAELLPGLYEMSDRGDLEYFQPEIEAPDLTRAWRDLDQMAQSLEPLVPDCHEAEPTCKILSLARKLIDGVRLSERETPRDLLRLLGEWETAPKPVKRYWGLKREEQNAALAAVTPLVDAFRASVVAPCLEAWRAYLYGQCVPFLAKVRAACQEERRQQGLVSFHDLLRKCVDLLREHPDVLAELQRRFRHLYVDEFQDTDPLQGELFLRLAADSCRAVSWLENRPRAGSLFIVGDPKQSIYRFRHADMGIYQSVRRHLLDCGGEVLALTTSFRSTRPVCNWLNQAFESLLPAQPCPQQAPFSALQSYRNQLDGVALYQLTQHTGRYTEVAQEEAQQIASYIQNSACDPGDFLILTSRRAELIVYQQALRQRGIPYQSGGEPLPLAPLGRAFLTLMHTLANPADNISLTGVLRGQFFGHSDRELFLHCQAGGFIRLGTEQEGLVSVRDSLHRLSQLRESIRTLQPGAAARHLIEELGLHWLAGHDELHSIEDELSERGQAGLTLVQAVVELLEADTIRPGHLHSGQRNVVRVMNIHKAKGLEARVVFLAAPTQGLPLQVDNALSEDGRGLFCLRRHRKLLAHPPDWHRLAEQELAFLTAERTRLLYVAATRAQEVLVVGRWSGSHGSAVCPWLPFEEFLAGCPELPIPPRTDAEAHQMLTTADQELRRRDDLAADQLACLLPSWRRSAVTASNKSKGFRSTLPADLSQGEGKDWGDLIHKLLEQLVLRPDLKRPELENLARWFTLERPHLTPYLDGALDLLDKIRAGEFWQRVLQSKERLAEVPFGRRSGSQLIFGVIDLLLSQEEGWDIVDYKTDRKRVEELLAAYAPQLEEYARSWTAITGESVLSAGIFGVREGRLVT